VVGARDGGVAGAGEAVEAAGEADEFDLLSEASEGGVVLLGLGDGAADVGFAVEEGC
jgi:hypothetical protein